MRDLLLINLSLMAKWKWRLLIGKSRLWRDILIVRYIASYRSRVSALLLPSAKTRLFLGQQLKETHIGFMAVWLVNMGQILKLPIGKSHGYGTSQ